MNDFRKYTSKILCLVFVNVIVSIFLTIFYFFPGLIAQNYGYLNLYATGYSVFQFILIFIVFYNISFLFKDNLWDFNKKILKLYFIVNIVITVSLWMMDLKYNKSWSMLYNVSTGSTTTLIHGFSFIPNIPDKFFNLRMDALLCGLAETIVKTVVVFIGLRKKYRAGEFPTSCE